MSNLVTALISSAIVIVGVLTTYVSTTLKQKTKNHNNLIQNNKENISDLKKSLEFAEEKFEKILNEIKDIEKNKKINQNKYINLKENENE